MVFEIQNHLLWVFQIAGAYLEHLLLLNIVHYPEIHFIRMFWVHSNSMILWCRTSENRGNESRSYNGYRYIADLNITHLRLRHLVQITLLVLKLALNYYRANKILPYFVETHGISWFYPFLWRSRTFWCLWRCWALRSGALRISLSLSLSLSLCLSLSLTFTQVDLLILEHIVLPGQL